MSVVWRTTIGTCFDLYRSLCFGRKVRCSEVCALRIPIDTKCTRRSRNRQILRNIRIYFTFQHQKGIGKPSISLGASIYALTHGCFGQTTFALDRRYFVRLWNRHRILSSHNDEERMDGEIHREKSASPYIRNGTF